jgi:hypothetical protein
MTRQNEKGLEPTMVENLKGDSLTQNFFSAANKHPYCKQGTEMRQLVCMSADVYCQITNNFYLRNSIILYSNGKKGKRALAPRETERKSVRGMESG